MADAQNTSIRTLLSNGITTSSPAAILYTLDRYRNHKRGLDAQTQLWAVTLSIKTLQPLSLRVLLEEFGKEILEKVGPGIVGAGWVRGTQEVDGKTLEANAKVLQVENAENSCREVLEILVDAGWDVNKGEEG